MRTPGEQLALVRDNSKAEAQHLRNLYDVVEDFDDETRMRLLCLICQDAASAFHRAKTVDFELAEAIAVIIRKAEAKARAIEARIRRKAIHLVKP